MDTGTGRADTLSQAPLERTLAVLLGELDVPEPALMLIGERAEPGADLLEVLAGEELLCLQHLGMGNRGAHVIAHQALIERRVAQYALIERCALVPKSAHVPLCCSAGVSALMSCTISVPVPSLVNTSARMLSLAL